jgi:hypothetical protein
VHLPSGDQANLRLEKLITALDLTTAKDKIVILGNFNENLQNENSELIQKLRDKQFHIGDLSGENRITTHKERSSLQYQIDKMAVQDNSANCCIFSNYKDIDYKVENQNSEHRFVKYLLE